jgi:hypothetical protein
MSARQPLPVCASTSQAGSNIQHLVSRSNASSCPCCSVQGLLIPSDNHLVAAISSASRLTTESKSTGQQTATALAVTSTAAIAPVAVRQKTTEKAEKVAPCSYRDAAVSTTCGVKTALPSAFEQIRTDASSPVSAVLEDAEPSRSLVDFERVQARERRDLQPDAHSSKSADVVVNVFAPPTTAWSLLQELKATQADSGVGEPDGNNDMILPTTDWTQFLDKELGVDAVSVGVDKKLKAFEVLSDSWNLEASSNTCLPGSVVPATFAGSVNSDIWKVDWSKEKRDVPIILPTQATELKDVVMDAAVVSTAAEVKSCNSLFNSKRGSRGSRSRRNAKSAAKTAASASASPSSVSNSVPLVSATNLKSKLNNKSKRKSKQTSLTSSSTATTTAEQIRASSIAASEQLQKQLQCVNRLNEHVRQKSWSKTACFNCRGSSHTLASCPFRMCRKFVNGVDCLHHQSGACPLEHSLKLRQAVAIAKASSV